MEFLPDRITLSDGRTLAFATLGPPDGFPVVYLHGGVGTALTPTPELREAVAQHGVQWVAVSRPGFGASTPHPGRTMRSVARDIGDLAAQRGWPRIAVAGVSSGGPFALACAAELPRLVGAVAIAASLSARCPPHAVDGLPAPTRAFMRTLAARPEACIRVLDRAARGLHRLEVPLARLAGPGRDEPLLALSAATRPGVRGAVEDFLVCGRPWGFDPTSITAEVHVWHGLQDRIAPAEHAWQLAAALPNCRIHVDPDESHFFFRRRSAEIAAQLARAAQAAPQGRAGNGRGAGGRGERGAALE